ncbi:hypothetical protein BJ742DRAFT_788629 [Cladochytrium replicatum]|nr:hypothetical protein BJ742DRAFT_788629 [Cladochytrium replicatum]
MCDVDQQPELVKAESRSKSNRNCQKCKVGRPTVYARSAYYCKACFCDTIATRFRFGISNKEMVADGSKVLVAYSGGPSSSCLLRLVKSHRRFASKLRYAHILLCHIDESEVTSGSDFGKYDFQRVRSLMEESGFASKTVSLSEVFSGASVAESVPETEGFRLRLSVSEMTPLEKLKVSLESVPKFSSKEDLIYQYRSQLLLQIAREENCQAMLLGDNATRLAIRVISQTSKGRGFSLPLEIAGDTNFHGDVIVTRPLREILSKEVAFFNHYEGIEFIARPKLTTGMPAKQSIDRLTEDFIVGLMNDYPATVNTVYRTASKVSTGLDRPDVSKCPLCGGPVQAESNQWRRRHTISKLGESSAENGSSDNKCDDSGCCGSGGCGSNVESVNVQPLLCYGCQNLPSDRDPKKPLLLPPYVLDGIKSKEQVGRNRAYMEEVVQEFILSDDDEP